LQLQEYMGLGKLWIDRVMGHLVASMNLLPGMLLLTLTWQSQPLSVDLLVASGDLLPLVWTPSMWQWPLP